MFARIHKAMEKREGGFTLIELLVVMIIIGILAAVAIPIFMNQQKTSRDTATTSDVKNVATNVQSLLVQEPDATNFAITTPANGKATVTVGSASNTVDVSVTSGTVLQIVRGTTAGTFKVNAYNPSGKNYTSTTKFLQYDSEAGGLNKTVQTTGWASAPVGP